MDEWLKVVVLGVIEGVTEFLPISSTGHLIIVSSLLDFQDGLRVTFDIFIQIGAVAAVLAFYARDIWQQFRRAGGDPQVRRLWLALIVACVPVALLGYLTSHWIKQTLFSPLVVAVSLIAGGGVMLLVERRGGRGLPGGPVMTAPPTLRQAVIVGIAQMISLIPGVSRSAASIIGGMAAGMGRKPATEFSFLLAVPTLGGAALYELSLVWHGIEPADLAYLLVGAAISAVVAWLSVRWLLAYISRNSFAPFGYYRIAIGLAVLVLIAVRVLPAGV